MGLPEGYRPRRGDVLIVHAVVKHDFDVDDAYVFARLGYKDLSIDLDKIASIHSFALEVGDQVEFDGGVGEVLALTDEHAWIKTDPGFRTFVRGDLRPIPKPEPEPETIAPPAPLLDLEVEMTNAPVRDSDRMEF